MNHDTSSQRDAKRADTPANTLTEDARLKALVTYHVMDSERDARFEVLAEDIARECRVPIATITFIDEKRQWFKAAVGVDVTETPRDVSVCTHTILDPGNALVIPDITQDPRFVDNPLVTGEFGLTAYAGVPIVTPDGAVLGTVCAMDREPHEYHTDDIQVLERVSQQVIELLETAKTANDLLDASDPQQARVRTETLASLLAGDSDADVPFALTRPLIEAIGEDLDVVQLVDNFVHASLEQFGWWGACVFWIQADRLKASPWQIGSAAPHGLATLADHRAEPIVLETLQLEFHDATLIDIGMARWLSDRDMLNALGARNLVVIDIAGAQSLAARIVFLTPSSRALQPTASRTLTTAAAVLPRVIVQQRARQELTYRATHDALTGLYNRQGVAHVFSPSRLNAPFSRAVLYLDIDNFKQINDEYSHRVGDEILVWLARMLNAQVRPTDTIFRIGGDEFLIVLDGIMDDTDMEKVAHRLLQRLVRPVTVQPNITVNVAVSIGAVRWESGPLDDAIAHADRLMYSAKELGGGRAACTNHGKPFVFGPATEATTELSSALNDAVTLDVQPVYDFASGEQVGVQFLLTAALRHPDIATLLDVIRTGATPHLASHPRNTPFTVQCAFDAQLWALEGFIVRLCVGVRERFPDAQVALVCDPRTVAPFTGVADEIRRGVGLPLILTRFGAGEHELTLLDTLRPNVIELDLSAVGSIEADGDSVFALPGVLVAARALADAKNMTVQAVVTPDTFTDTVRHVLQAIDASSYLVLTANQTKDKP